MSTVEKAMPITPYIDSNKASISPALNVVEIAKPITAASRTTTQEVEMGQA